ncbi:MAG: hypothetical protein H8E39_09050 [Alphaproteobacteria bacterium]|nr:hypothetical protein [Alphaproteobacteria bacterium]
MTQVKMGMVVDRIGVVESYSVPVISAAAKAANHDVLLVEYDKNPKAAAKAMKAFNPDVLAYSVMSPDAEKYIEINKHLKAETGAYSLLGCSPDIFPGIHPKGRR